MGTRSQSRCPLAPYSPPASKHRSRTSFTPQMDDSDNYSYIIIHDLSPEAKMLYLSPSLTEVLGYEPRKIIGTSSFDWLHPDEVETVRQLHYDTIRDDKAAAIAYLRVRNRDDQYVHCVIQRSVVFNALIGSISFAKAGSKALHTAATAQEVTFVTPSALAAQLKFRRWNDPVPSPSLPLSPPRARLPPEAFSQLPMPSRRTGLILNRFSRLCPILYCTNDCIFPASRVVNRSFYDFVSPADEANVRSWIDTSKGWGVSPSGMPSDGGFVFGSFNLCLEGRNSAHGDSRVRTRSGTGTASATGPHDQADPNEGVPVDAIFSAHSDGFIVVLRRADQQHG